jgi:hypothetical protein
VAVAEGGKLESVRAKRGEGSKGGHVSGLLLTRCDMRREALTHYIEYAKLSLDSKQEG